MRKNSNILKFWLDGLRIIFFEVIERTNGRNILFNIDPGLQYAQ